MNKRFWSKHYWKVILGTLLALNLAVQTPIMDHVTQYADKLSNAVRQSNKTSTSDTLTRYLSSGKHFGVATQTWYLSDGQYSKVANSNFDMVTPEYQMKMSEIQSTKGVFRFNEADDFVNWAKKNNKLVRGHTLIWHDALPSWVENGNYSRDQWIEILKNHITQTVRHFKGKIYAWDVVNEAFYTNGDYRPSVWYTNIGPEYIEMAFRFARAADPNVKLFYNDFDAEVTNEKSNAIYNMIKSLKAKGVPIDGIGFQTHLAINGVNYNDMQANFKRFAALGLDTDITEMDVVTHTFQGTHEQKLAAEAEVYKNVFNMFLKLPSAKSFVVWGLRDDHSWLNTDTGYQEYPLLFDNDYNPKPAYTALLNLVKR
ncbi:endo-1,4-beta-xylanase [Cohnella sp. AR92]|uniref:endo-1,4-beta-xylanase n=1 Tax=Cohnella sp. AR92 TaxID=648716 RepID=UPI000F8D8629|nr:endo-1,4-beta-xylanase [Cohnella sp. AR92]RUS42606.1 endo-1,4-beta-xylanase [Cohnella sp. AR92]